MNIEFTTIAWSSDSGYQSFIETVIRNSEQWINLWRLHTSNADPPSPVPLVDFACHSIVAVFAGEKQTGGYSVEILKIESFRTQEQPSIVATVQHRQPQPGDFVTEALTYPNHIIKIPKIDVTNVVFQHV